MKRPSPLLSAALVATLVATWWAAGLEDEAGRSPAGPAGARAPRAQTGAEAGGGRSDGGATGARPAWPAAGAGIFRPHRTEPAPEAVVDSMPPPEPAGPPPLPFRFIGKLEEHGRLSVVLMEGETVYVLSAGQAVDERYRVDRITPTQVELTYLPLRQRQLLEIATPYDSFR